MIGPRILYTAAALFAVCGVALRYAPVSLPAVAPATVPEPPAAAQTRQPPPVEPKRFTLIVANNAFAAGRAAPAVRFVPEGLRRDSQPAPRTPKKSAEPVARLFGITRGPEGTVALIDADPTVPGAEVYKVGDKVRGGVITNISETTVTLSRPSGRLVLHLPDARDRR
jgi:hypothetical protein